MKKGCLKIGCLTPIVLIILFLIIGTIIEYQLRYKYSIPSILGLENVEVECIDRGRSWWVNYEVYKLSDKDMKSFLEKPNKTIPDRDNWDSHNWTRASIDSLNHFDIAFLSRAALTNFKTHTKSMIELYYNDSYYAFYGGRWQTMRLYVIDEENKLLYITNYWF